MRTKKYLTEEEFSNLYHESVVLNEHLLYADSGSSFSDKIFQRLVEIHDLLRLPVAPSYIKKVVNGGKK